MRDLDPSSLFCAPTRSSHPKPTSWCGAGRWRSRASCATRRRRAAASRVLGARSPPSRRRSPLKVGPSTILAGPRLRTRSVRV